VINLYSKYIPKNFVIPDDYLNNKTVLKGHEYDFATHAGSYIQEYH